MKLTCLSRGKGIHFPPCYVLNVCGIRILIDCPIDLSALTVFSPLHHECSGGRSEENSECSVDDTRDPNSSDTKRQKIEKPLTANVLIHAEPWYKTVTNLHLWNVSFIDVVLISSPMGMLGLPFLTRDNRFSAKIYVTEATAKLGKLMMDDLVSMHTEFRQFYGPAESGTPHWMNWEELELLPFALREIVLGMDGMELGGWVQLYSAADIEDCVKKVQTLKYAEEVFYNGCIIVQALSSGSEIGACNWTLKSPDRSIAWISNSSFAFAQAQEFDYHALREKDVIIYTDFSSLNIWEDVAPDGHSATSENSFPLSGLEDVLLHADENSMEMDKLDFICSCVIDSVKAGGSALIPIDRLRIILPLLERLSFQLESSELKVPIYMISSVAEEILAFTNVIPEWLCKQRQEKLFSGEALFAHIELLREGKLQAYPAIHSPKLLSNWREPCIVFCPHWSLRLGPAVQLLQRWQGDQNSLLVLEEGVDSDVNLLPFSVGMKMKVLQCSFLSGIRSKQVLPLLEFLHPKFFLLPECLKQHIRSSDDSSFSIIHYSVNETVRLPSMKDRSEVDISTDLISQLQWRNLEDEKLTIARLKGTLAMCEGKCRIMSGNNLPSSRSGPLLCWGSPNLESLLDRLSQMGVSGTLQDNAEEGLGNASSLHIHSPDKALVEVRKMDTAIVAPNKELGSRIFEAVSNVLDGI